MLEVIRDEAGVLLYEGATRNGKPFGAGTAYYCDGTIYQEGIFGIKGLICGREYYTNGQVRFEGIYRLNRGYGPNWPEYGTFYDQDGIEQFHGEFEVRTGGVGYPMVSVPEGFGPVVQKDHPELKHAMWQDVV